MLVGYKGRGEWRGVLVCIKILYWGCEIEFYKDKEIGKYFRLEVREGEIK